MFENFKKIKIQGGCFENETEFELFNEQAISVVYGRNGSGKTTIAHCICELVKQDEEKSLDYTVTSESIITEDKKNSVFIFDEDFVREQVRVEKDGINTIVMLGEQVELDEQIVQKDKQLIEKKKEYDKLNEDRQKFDNDKEKISPHYYFNQIRNALRAEGGWADIDRELKGNAVKSRVNDEVVNVLMELNEPQDTLYQLSEQLMKDLNLYQHSKDAQEITWSKIIPILPKELLALSKLLTKTLDAPKLSDRESRLISLLSTHSQYSTDDTKRLIDDNLHFCPLCLREITEQDKEDISQTITRILNEEAQKYDICLQEAIEIFAKVETSLPLFNGNLNENEINAAQTAITNLNDILYRIREKINQRKRNIYETLREPFTEEDCKTYSDALCVWENVQDVLEQCVKQFNESVKERKKLKKQVQMDNNLLARKQLASIFGVYKQALVNKHKNQQELEAKTKECEKIQSEIKLLKVQKECTDIALSYINKELQYVFYSNRKVKLEPGDGCYKLKINDRAVAPNKISVGERNVLGLCYFFVKLFGGKTEATKYASECLIVIDDPVSSFDYGNRVGVMSLLRFQFVNLLKGNPNSRILVMSHDLQSIFDLTKIRNEIIECKERCFKELVNHKLEHKNLQNEYKKLLTTVFDYASNTVTNDLDDVCEISIGNIMRRMLEAFSSFCYNSTFEKMLRNEDILMGIPEEKRNYYGNFMCRLTLNTESHMEESVYTLNNIFSYFTKCEKIQTAKSVLLFLLYINKLHLKAYLEEKNLAEIESWMTKEM